MNKLIEKYIFYLIKNNFKELKKNEGKSWGNYQYLDS